jgi:transcriptional regulator with XRE-family HTH domain
MFSELSLLPSVVGVGELCIIVSECKYKHFANIVQIFLQIFCLYFVDIFYLSMERIDLKAFRRANKISQLDLAGFFGVGQSFISQVEKGSRPLPKEHISKLLAQRSWDTSMLVRVDVKKVDGATVPIFKPIDVVQQNAPALQDAANKLLIKDYQRQIADKDATIQELCKKIGMLEAKIELLGKGDITPESV